MLKKKLKTHTSLMAIYLMNKMNDYYVYAHINKHNSKRYIGITCQTPTKRWGKDGSKYHDSPKFYKAIIKYGWDSFEHVILHENLSKDEACELEQYYIQLYKSNTKNGGYNITSGGENPSCTKETREKISQAKLGHEVSLETRRKQSEAKMGSNHPKARKIICLETKDIYDTAISVYRCLGIHDTHVLNCCKGKLKSCGKDVNGNKLHWMFYDDYLNIANVS